MEIPFLKNNRKNQGGGGVITERVSDEGASPDKLLDMVAEELIDAVHKKDRAGLVHALRAAMQMIQDEDQEQDAL